MERLLLVDATHQGSRVVAVGDRGYIVLSDDNGKTWRRAKSPAGADAHGRRVPRREDRAGPSGTTP